MSAVAYLDTQKIIEEYIRKDLLRITIELTYRGDGFPEKNTFEN